MGLGRITADDQRAVLDALSRQADQAAATVADDTPGLFGSLISKDTGGGERTAIKSVTDRAIPALRQLGPQAESDDDAGDRWRDLAQTAQTTLSETVQTADASTVGAILSQTAKQTVADTGHVAAQAAGAVAGLIPWQAYAVAAVVVVALGFVMLRRSGVA